jgi:hypothetical protein
MIADVLLYAVAAVGAALTVLWLGGLVHAIVTLAIPEWLDNFKARRR